MPQPPERTRWVGATWTEEVGFAATNAFVYGLLAGLGALLDERDFSEAFVRGAVGGLVGYGGKRVAVARFDGAALVGRAIHGLGVSIAASDANQGLIPREVLLPLGALWVSVDRRTSAVSARLDVPTAYWLTYGLIESRLSLHWGRSLSSGTPVFMTQSSELRDASGVTAAGVVFLEQRPEIEAVLTHELVHVLQYDMSYGLVTRPLDARIGELIGSSTSRIQRWVHVGISNVLLAPGSYFLQDLREVEATFLELNR